MNTIVCILNEDDTFKVDSPSQILDLTNKKEYHYTFYRSLTRLYKMPKAFKKEALDLLYISMAVYFADRRVLRSDNYDGWTREFKLYRSEEHTSELQSRPHLVCSLLLEKKKYK